ncbi:GNAT family N-acetyltransferase [Catenovulum sp. 2E275]|nr:GNAT family N-acetyltransferase [Catenovulum sp. 2E275]MCU4674298.1 GNAT family N-acetyltransferase [Catenovulum sp. 2E275]
MEVNYKHDDWGEQGRISALDDQNEIGYLVWKVKNSKLWLADLMIHDESNRGKGIGTKLLNELDKIAAQYKADKIWGTTSSEDLPVHRFYRKNGYSVQVINNEGYLEK